jgi:outer membrane protein OmpA-like peptidoglycan-associated protein
MGVLRAAASAVLLSVSLGACSSVPDAINPVSWYEKTTDFFSGDSQAADAGAMPSGQNNGLAADPNAPPPAPAPSQSVERAPSGLNAAQTAGNYASPPIERQGAPSNVLAPQSEVASAPSVAPPVPVAQPSAAVSPAPTMPSMPAKPLGMGATPPPPSIPGFASAEPSSASSSASMTPPPPFEFPPVNAMSPYGDEGFETVVITADGMETVSKPAAQPQRTMEGGEVDAYQAQNTAMFPDPSATHSPEFGAVTVNGMLRVATIHFANNAANLDQRDRSILGAVIQLQKERGGRVVVVGHASARTKDMDYIKHQMVNFEISMNRAGAIGTALKNLGLSDQSLEVQAVSDTQPLYMEVMPSGEASNRRVEIYLAGAAT